MAAPQAPSFASGRPQQPSLPRRVRACTSIEDQVRHAYYVPNPASYSPINSHSQGIAESKRLGKISESRIPSVLDYSQKVKAFVPGPGFYNTPDTREFPLPEGGRVSRNAPVERFKPFDEYPRPSPGEYGVPNDPARPRHVNGAFTKEKRVSKYIQEAVDRSKKLPGPGDHDVVEAMDSSKPFCPEGGRCLMQTKPPSYFDQAPLPTEGNPPPDAYNISSGLKSNVNPGKLVYRYESATIGETRELVQRYAGSGDAPAPGTYNVPDPAHLGGAPTLKGRQLPYAMPHPFAYNCQPDYDGKFAQQPSVLQRNSAELIFGTGVKRGMSQSKGSAKNSRPSSGDRVKDKELPPSVGPLAAEQPEAQVEWKAGGFATIKRSKSAAVIKAEHPSVREAAKCYPMLQKRHRSSSQFLPMTVKRIDSVPTHEGSEECDRLRCGKWYLGSLAAGLQKATDAALEVLDEEKLKRDAIRGLSDKAKERMRLEGVSYSQQQLILHEMRDILQEQVHITLSQEPIQEILGQQNSDNAVGTSDEGVVEEGVEVGASSSGYDEEVSPGLSGSNGDE